MHFLELLFGFSPDAGTGLTELTMLLLPLVASLLAIRLSRSRRRSAEYHCFLCSRTLISLGLLRTR